MQCPNCGYKEMEERIYDETVSHGEESKTLTGMKGQVCPSCGEVVWDKDSYDRFFKVQDELVIAARKKRNKNVARSACMAMTTK